MKVTEQIEWIRTRRSRDIDHDIADSLEKLWAVFIETSGLIGAFEHELREVVGHTNVNCIKEKLSAFDPVQTIPAQKETK